LKFNENIIVHLKEIGWEGVKWIHLAHLGNKWVAVVKMAMNLRVA
jgi:hypothetical protein